MKGKTLNPSDSLKKKRKDKEKPVNERKPITPFFLFMNQMKARIRAQAEPYSDIKGNNQEIAKVASQVWQRLPDIEKEQWR